MFSLHGVNVCIWVQVRACVCVFIIRSVAEGITIIKMQRCAPVCGKV